ncbi:M48 family metallopeptidase [Povalibacter sp.]|uniref:M48 family metallopeptidase n=1 Tax=Povalibacter sp. TaxID=1962978 RepID=UPI002F424FEF
MHWFTLLFVLLLMLSTLLRSWLNQRQIAAVARHREKVPDAFAGQVDLDSHRKAADYTVALGGLNRWDILLDALVALAFTLGGGIQAIDHLWQAATLSPVWHGTVVVLSTLLAMSAIGLPLSIYRTFGIEAHFGFNRMTAGLFIADLLKGLLLMLLLGGPLLYVILYLMQRAGSLWWLYAWGVWTAFTLFITWAWPTFIAPLFNKFTPLGDEALKQRTESLLQRCGFASQGVFVMDGSRRSVHGNAYFTGVGRNKRIVFFDTLIERLHGAEIEAVLAHELGHFRLHHVRSRLILSLLFGLGGLALLGLLAAWPPFYQALGIGQPSAHAALLLFMLVLPTFTFFLTPLGAWWSRKHEFEADEFAAEFSDAGKLAEALVKLYRDNATTLTPDTLHSTFYDSHPPALIRIARLQQLAAQRI